MIQKMTWGPKVPGTSLEPGDVAKATTDDKKTVGWIICCPCGCGGLKFFDQSEDDMFTKGQADLTLFYNIRFKCGNVFSLLDGVFGDPK